MSKVPLTLRGAEKLRAELTELKTVARPKVIEGKLSHAQIIDVSTLNAGGKVVFGATVDVEDVATGDEHTYQIVGEDEADIKAGLISITSPIARSLIGKSEGDVASFETPGGVRELEILEVRYE